MAQFKPLVQTSELKTSLIMERARSHKFQPTLLYDKQFDVLFLLFIAADSERVAHYVDDDVALLYLPDTLEIIGVQIEDFEHQFLPTHQPVNDLWRFREQGASVEDMGDVLSILEMLKPKIAVEVLKAVGATIGEPGAELIAAFAS